MEHVKSVEIHYTSGHSVISEAHLCACVNDKPSTLFPVSRFRFVVDAIEDGRRFFLEIFLVIIPARHSNPQTVLSCSKQFTKRRLHWEHLI